MIVTFLYLFSEMYICKYFASKSKDHVITSKCNQGTHGILYTEVNVDRTVTAIDCYCKKTIGFKIINLGNWLSGNN